MQKDLTREDTGFAAELADVTERLCRSTVQVLSGKTAVGSGVIWHANGLIVTNSHVVHKSHATVQLADGRVFDAVCKSRDPQRDLATLEVAATDLPAATIADSNVQVGQLVLAVGNPLGLVGALSAGIISRLYPAANDQGWVMADLRLFPGNSGGPLADAQGRVIGINSMIVGGLALAVPSQAVKRFLRLGRRPYLGVTIQPVPITIENKRVCGLLVLEVHPNSLAESAVLTGDVLIGANGRLFEAPSDLSNALQVDSGNVLQLDFNRGGKRMTCDVHLQQGGDGMEAA